MHASVPTPGTIVWIRQRRWRVESARLDHGVVRLDVADRDRRMTFLTPFDRPAYAGASPRVRCVRPQQALARIAGLLARTPAARGLPTTTAADIEILPHQFEPALALADGVRRVLVADDVGLGKTVQAGLAIAELCRRWPSLRGLVLVPATVKDQWQQELNRRFGVHAEIADRDAQDAALREARYGTNPWSRAGVWIASIDFLKQPHVGAGLPAVPWDILVIDEAHDVCGSSARHRVCDQIARRARQVLLLTATPHSGDAVRFDRLENLGRLQEKPDGLTTFRRTRASLGMGSGRRVRWHYVDPSPPERRVFDALEGFERAVLAAATADRREGAVLLLSVLRKRALSTMTALAVSIERRLSWIDAARHPSSLDWVQPRLDLAAESGGGGDDDCAALGGEIDLGAAVERTWLRRIRSLTESALDGETKITRIVRLLARAREPVVIFTEFRHSLEAIERRARRSRPLAMLHGGQPASERRQELDRFRRGNVSVLLATDVASQGLNLQERARWVVSVEMPWTPTRLEQRIGRVDRIGQRRTVHASLLVNRHSAEAGLLARIALRTLAVRRSIGSDALPDAIPPGERAVAEAIFDVAGGGANQAPLDRVRLPLVSSLNWQRRARALARQLLVRRALGSRWRSPGDTIGRPCWTKLRRSSGLGAMADSDALAVMSVSIVDGTGFVIERRILCLAVRGITRETARAFVRSGTVAALVRAHLGARLARVRRIVVAESERRVRIEHAIALDVEAAGGSGARQPGLFDRREERARAAAARQVDEVARETDAGAKRWRSVADVHLGSPSVEVLLFWTGPPRRSRRLS